MLLVILLLAISSLAAPVLEIRLRSPHLIESVQSDDQLTANTQKVHQILEGKPITLRTGRGYFLPVHFPSTLQLDNFPQTASTTPPPPLSEFPITLADALIYAVPNHSLLQFTLDAAIDNREILSSDVLPTYGAVRLQCSRRGSLIWVAKQLEGGQAEVEALQICDEQGGLVFSPAAISLIHRDINYQLITIYNSFIIPFELEVRILTDEVTAVSGILDTGDDVNDNGDFVVFPAKDDPAHLVSSTVPHWDELQTSRKTGRIPIEMSWEEHLNSIPNRFNLVDDSSDENDEQRDILRTDLWKCLDGECAGKL